MLKKNSVMEEFYIFLSRNRLTKIEKCGTASVRTTVAIRTGPGIQPPWMLFEHGIGQSQLVLQAEVF